jgi:hypothetical protein
MIQEDSALAEHTQTMLTHAAPSSTVVPVLQFVLTDQVMVAETAMVTATETVMGT